ncbi:MAG: hypothetical protein J6X72_01650, partial [Clostridia bacterium]|nr:hypothetical protein [Clostridia bacterium]
MKKLTIALALILCLLMCVFCFASCKKKNKTTNETTAATTVEATTAHVHTPAADFTVDQQPTCVRAGSKSKHCTVCNEIITETVTSVPATGEHTVEEWTETPSTLIRAGSKTGTCTVCHQPVTETFEKTEPIIYLTNWDDATRMADPNSILNPDYTNDKPTEHYIFGVKKNVKSIIGNDGIFYPTEENDKGNDLLIEFSFLYNDTVAANASGDGTIAVMYVENNNVFNVDLKSGKITAKERTGDAYILPTPEDIAADASVKQVAIGEYGWHRFAARIHEDAKIEADAVVYTVTASAYLDGVKIFEVDKTTWATQNFAGNYTGLLYTAEIEEGA